MISLQHTPGLPLSQFVDLIWYYQGISQPHKLERLLPQGTVELVLNLREDRCRIYDCDLQYRPRHFPGAMVCGPHSNFFVIDTAGQAEVLGVHFRAGGAFPFVGMPADELHNRHAGLDVLWGAPAAELRERILAAPTPRCKVRAMERFLMTHLFKPLERHPAVDFALQEFRRSDLPAVATVTNQIGLSSRHFIQLFSQEVGLSPKLYCRVQRFQRVLQIVHGGRDVDWAEIALSCGYFDQAHFNHDFKEFSGINPTAYLSARTEHLNHLPIQD